MRLYFSNIAKVGIENPVGFLGGAFRKADQIINPYFFGDSQVKPTCLWLKNLPKLVHVERPGLFGEPVTHVAKPAPLYTHIRKPSANYNGTEVKNRYFVDAGAKRSAHIRSQTFPGIARAMAEQWG